MAEIPFEHLLGGLETDRGVPVEPTHHLGLAGTIAPMRARYRPEESRGTLAQYHRSVTVREWSEFSAEGGLSVYTLPVLLNAIVAGGVAAPGTQPVDAVKTQLWEFAPAMAEDDLQSLTLYWGDPNVQAFQAAFCLIDELTIDADASGTDGVTLSISGQGWFPAKTAPAQVPAALTAPILLPGAAELWIDTTQPIGTTAIVGKVVKAEVKIPLEGSRKWLAAGPGVGLNYSAVGRGKRHCELKLTLELPDLDEYDLWTAETPLKTRLRLNGPAIETVGTPEVTYYHGVEVDIYGPFDALAWGEHEGTNRTAELTVLSEYDADAGHDWCVRVQNDRATL